MYTPWETQFHWFIPTWFGNIFRKTNSEFTLKIGSPKKKLPAVVFQPVHFQVPQDSHQPFQNLVNRIGGESNMFHQEVQEIYTLVNYHVAMEYHHFQWGMHLQLVYQSVYEINVTLTIWLQQWNYWHKVPRNQRLKQNTSNMCHKNPNNHRTPFFSIKNTSSYLSFICFCDSPPKKTWNTHNFLLPVCGSVENQWLESMFVFGGVGLHSQWTIWPNDMTWHNGDDQKYKHVQAGFKVSFFSWFY